MDEMQKYHLFHHIGLAFYVGLAVVFGFLCIVFLYAGLEQLSIGNQSYFGWSVIMSIGMGSLAVWSVYAFYRSHKRYLDTRTLKVPEVCPECKENLHRNDVKWIKPEKAECPHCGIELEVTKGWE